MIIFISQIGISLEEDNLFGAHCGKLKINKARSHHRYSPGTDHEREFAWLSLLI